MPSPADTRLPAWAAPLGFRWFAPTLFLAVCLGILGFATFTWLERPTAISKLLLPVLWVAILVGAVLMVVAWRALLRSSDARGRVPSGGGDTSV